jgi:hypothetical protein
MISSTSSSDRTGPSDAVTGAGQSASRLRARPDRISIDNAAFLSSELERQQEIRPEALARGREVLSNPDYPFGAAISKVAEQIVNSSDLTEDLS